MGSAISASSVEAAARDIKEFAKSAGAAAVGIASVDDISRYAPEGYRPDDILPGAKSVVVLGGPTVLSGSWRSPEVRITGTTRYFPIMRRGAAARVTHFIESNYGYYSLFYDGANSSGLTPFMSLKLCAEMAGLGTRGLNGGIILNKKLGMLNFSAALTTMPLIGDGALREAVCPHDVCVAMWRHKKTTPCLDACPTCLSGELDGSEIKWMEFKRQQCAPHAQTYSTMAFQKMLLEIINEDDKEKRKMMVFGDYFTRIVKSITAADEVVGQCYECTRVCPVCVDARQLRPRVQ